MNTKKSLFFLIVIIITIILPAVIVVLPLVQFESVKLRTASDRGVSGYQIAQSVTYQVDINFSFTHLSGPSGYNFFKFARLNDRQPNSPLTQYCGPYQESKLQFSRITGSETTPLVVRDRFNNTYDVFEANNLLPSESVTLNQKYIVKLNEVSFNSIDSSEIGEYDTSDEIFALYCNYSEEYYEKGDFNINATSYGIVNPGDNPVVKARKIYDWVGKHLEYGNNLPAEEMGAKWAYENQIGDCSEYSSLMVTLLRCQGIPARKVVGTLITNEAYTNPYIGQEWSFFYRRDGKSNISNHAWIEYYVPNIGWIACDPTWGDNEGSFKPPNYFNRIDCFRLNLNVGAWFSVPIFSDISEFCNPCIVALGHLSLQNATIIDFEYMINIKVIDTNFNASEMFDVTRVTLACGMIGIPILIKGVKKRQKNSNALK